MQTKSAVTILIVEDHPIVRQLFAAAFEDEGYTVLQAGDGQEAVALLQQQQPAVVILDYAMPLMNGIAVARWVRASDAHANVRIVACCGMPDALKDARDLFDAVVGKPVQPSELVNVVCGLLATDSSTSA
jgi:CheY-like chemotaxis protein